MSAYIDTSVLGAYYCPEPGSKSAEHVLLSVEGPIISILSEVEFCSLVSKKMRRRELTERQGKAILELFGSHVAEGFYGRVALVTEHYIKARQLFASSIPLHTLDALHLAIAIAEGVPIVTSDRALTAAAKRHKVPIVLVK